ncbi:hypothetical protein BJ741DRAFT_712996 [Chytriomyces cf. hyalinus JEL632]|nr:hypothetical protein BJ741DRAFT_712996 [Chytriomyces cf. hyalinus JEL632]
MSDHRNSRTAFKLSYDNIDRFPAWFKELRGIAASTGNTVHTIYFNYDTHDACKNPFINNALADQTDPSLLRHARFDNPTNPANPYTLTFANVPNVAPGTPIDNMAMDRMIRTNCDSSLEKILPNNCEMAQTLIQILRLRYLNTTLSQIGDLTKEWVDLKQLDTDTFTQYWDHALDIYTRMQTDPVAPEHVPFLDLSRTVDHIIRGLLPSVYRLQMPVLQNEDYTSLSQLYQLSTQLKRIWTGNQSQKTLHCATTEPAEATYSAVVGVVVVLVAFRGTGRGKWHGGNAQQSHNPTTPTVTPVPRDHVLEDTGRPRTPCPICSLPHWKLQCHKHPDYAFNALLPFPAGKRLIPFQRVRKDHQNDAIIKALYACEQQYQPQQQHYQPQQYRPPLNYNNSYNNYSNFVGTSDQHQQQIRIGFCSGPVTAQVVGEMNPSKDSLIKAKFAMSRSERVNTEVGDFVTSSYLGSASETFYLDGRL